MKKLDVEKAYQKIVAEKREGILVWDIEALIRAITINKPFITMGIARPFYDFRLAYIHAGPKTALGYVEALFDALKNTTLVDIKSATNKLKEDLGLGITE